MPDLEDLARRLAGCPQLAEAGYLPPGKGRVRTYMEGPDGAHLTGRQRENGCAWLEEKAGSGWVPYLDDPATVGCLRAMIDGYRGSADRGAPGRPEWLVLGDPSFGPPEDLGLYGKGDTEAEAIARLLLRQWGATPTEEQASAREKRRRSLLQELLKAMRTGDPARIEEAEAALDGHDKRWRR